MAAIFLTGVVSAPVAPASDRTAAPSRTPPAADAPGPPPPRPPEISEQLLPPVPAAGKGRLALLIGGNRRWCTYPDDRLVQPPRRPGTFQKRNEVFTFGYKFTVSAVKRGQADTPLMLFESPVFRTASWLPASKLGQAKKSGPAGPIIIPEANPMQKPKEIPKGPDTLVPYWHDVNRCVTLPERMDFDLDPGTYDVYIAFDLLNREGGWVHRTTGYLTDVSVEAARATRLDGLINLAAGSDRQVELQGSMIEPDATASPGSPGP
jgi:hypothetical protein